MRLENITAMPHPAGNRIDLMWINADPVAFPGVRVVRREGTHPSSPEDGIVVVEGEGRNSARDENLKGETVYYYALFPYRGDPPEYEIDRHNRAAAIATAPYDIAGQMYGLLPAIYHRYDTVLPKTIPAGMAEEDQQRGQLRRFLDLPGSQLDLLYSFARALLGLYNLDRVDGRLLPLLAEWIGWKSDYRLELDAQGSEIRNAPAIYKAIGLIPTVEATVKRISGWESRTKEFVHNVFVSNRPERLNIWTRQRDSTGTWAEPAELLSLDFAYEGRPTAVRDGEGTLWLFYHTYKKKRWDIWYKTHSAGGWVPSHPLTNRVQVDKHPAAALQGDTLWVFWGAYEEANRKWRIDYRTRSGGEWFSIDEPSTRPWRDEQGERKAPAALVDQDGGLWLFWLERAGPRWQLKYNRRDGTVWQLDPPANFPMDGTDEPRVEGDLFVLFHPRGPNRRIWVFWARKEPTGEPDQTRWTIAYRFREGIDPSVSDWSPIRTLPKDPPNADYHDREPAALVDPDGNIELFWSSNRDGNWSIWRNSLDLTTGTWGTEEEQVTNTPYSQRDPLPLSIDDGTLLIYRSNERLAYTSQVYRATETVDFRYAGSTTAHTRNTRKNTLRGKFEDFQTYTYDAGENGERTNEDWYARDTIGLYLVTDTMDADKIGSGISRIDKVLSEFMPITDRAVFITRSDLQTEHVYTYGLPVTGESKFISESYRDTFTSVGEAVVTGPAEDFSDEIE